MKSAIQEISYKGVLIKILRLDILHPEIQGNKYYKLKYNLEKAKELNQDTILTFGGEYSNHIHATALAGIISNFKTIGIIRGDKPIKNTCTVQDAIQNKMEIHYLNRTDYRIARKIVHQKKFEELYLLLEKNEIYISKKQTYIIPEGGTNKLAIKGTSEILKNAKNCDYLTVCTSVGTAGTIAGIITSLGSYKKLIGFPALKGNFFEKEIKNLLDKPYNNWILNHNYHFKGFGAYNNELILFINKFNQDYNIPLCTLYTGKMFYGIFDMIDKGILSNKDKILAIHTGGIQGINAFNEKNGNLLI